MTVKLCRSEPLQVQARSRLCLSVYLYTYIHTYIHTPDKNSKLFTNVEVYFIFSSVLNFFFFLQNFVTKVEFTLGTQSLIGLLIFRVSCSLLSFFRIYSGLRFLLVKRVIDVDSPLCVPRVITTQTNLANLMMVL